MLSLEGGAMVKVVGKGAVGAEEIYSLGRTIRRRHCSPGRPPAKLASNSPLTVCKRWGM